MRRSLLCFTTVILLFATSSNAQFTKGMRMAGATIGGAFFNSGTYDYTVPSPTFGYSEKVNSLGVNLSPNFGWFVSDKTVIGGQLLAGYKYDKNLKTDPSDITYSKNISKGLNLGFGGFARNYFSSISGLAPFAQVGFTVGMGSTNNNGFYYNNAPLYKDSYKGKSSGDFTATGSLAVGVTKLINSHIGLDVSAGYTFSHNKNKYKTTTQRDIDIDGSINETLISDLTTEFTNHGFALGVGFQLFLEKRK